MDILSGVSASAEKKDTFKVRLILSGAVCVLILSGVYYLIENLTDWSYWGQVPLLFITYFSAVLIFTIV